MIYNLNQALSAVESQTIQSYMEGGINENIKLTRVRKDRTDNGNNYLAFDFEDKNGAKLTHTEWEPKPRPGFSDITTKAATQMAKVLQIMRVYIPVTELNREFADFNGFAEWVVDTMSKHDHTKLVRLKVVYNWSTTKNKDYASLPTYGKYPFIEAMDITPSRLRIMDIDRIERLHMPDKEEVVKNPFATNSQTELPTEIGKAPTVTSEAIPF